MMFIRIIFCAFALFLLTSCGGDKFLSQINCPNIYVLDRVDKFDRIAPGFERTNKKLYQVEFLAVSYKCEADSNNIEITAEIELDYKKSPEIKAVAPPFDIFISFLDKEKKLIFREKITYTPEQWQESDTLLVRDKIQISYPYGSAKLKNVTYIYMGFALPKAKLLKQYRG